MPTRSFVPTLGGESNSDRSVAAFRGAGLQADGVRGQPAGSASASTPAWVLSSGCMVAAVTASASLARRRPALRSLAARRAAAEAVAEAPPPPPPPFNPAIQLGVTAPLGYFDPLGFCKVGDYEGFHKLRCAELKHGRVAMLASIGTVFAHFVKLPGFQGVPAGLGSLGDGAAVLGLVTLLPVVGLLETIYWQDDVKKEPGNFGDPAKWASTGLFGAGSYSEDMRNKELNNGRAAMIAILGIIIAEIATGKDGVQQFGLP